MADQVKKKKSNLTRIFAAILILVSALILIYVEINQGAFNNFYIPFISINENTQIETVIKYEQDNRVSFRTFSNSVLQCTKDGVKCYSDSGVLKWTETFTFSSPFMVSRDNITAIGETKGRLVYVFNESGKMYSVTADYPILQMSVNKNGQLAIIQQAAEYYKINLFYASGNPLFEIVMQEENVFPLDCDISEDGRILAVSYVDISEQIVTKLLFYYLNSDEGKNHKDGMFSAFNEMDQITPIIRFMDDGKLICIADNNIYAIGVGYDEIIWRLDLNNRIEKIAFDSKKYIAVAYGEGLPGKKPESEGTLVWINLYGEIINSVNLGNKITHLSMLNNVTIAGTTRKFYSLNSNGKENWQYTATQDILSALPFNSNRKMLLVTKNEAQILKIGKNNHDLDTIEEITAQVQPRYFPLTRETSVP